MLLEFKGCVHEWTGVAEEGVEALQSLAIALGQLGLGIEEVKSAGPTLLEQPDHGIGAGGESRDVLGNGLPRGRRGKQPLVLEQGCQGQHAHARTASCQHVPTGPETGFFAM